MFSHSLESSPAIIAIKSPLQALNAVEFYHHHKDSINLSALQIIVFCSHEKPVLAHTIKSIIQRIGCHNIYVIPTLPSGKKWWHPLKEYLSAIRFRNTASVAISKSSPAPLLLIGDYRSRECLYLAFCIPSSEIMLLDDGSATHQIARHRRDRNDPKLAPMFPKQDLRAFRLKLWAGIQTPFIERLTFFTHYNVEPSAQDTIIHHQYEFWRSVLLEHNPPVRDIVLFLGMSHVEKGLTSEPRYLEALSKIRAHYGTRRVIYRPHRDEAATKLAAVKCLGFEVAPSDPTPVELLLIEGDSLPSEVASIASSALDNLAIIMGDRITLRCFLPGSDYCTSAMSGHFADIIRYHQKGNAAGIQITELPRPLAPHAA